MLKKRSIDLLRKVKRHILEEPKRIDMTIWKRTKETTWRGDKPQGGWPECGTVACIGGWVETLNAIDHPSEEYVHARDILGLNIGQEDQLFYEGSLMKGKTQTRRHALMVAQHIENFIRRHRRK